MQTKLSKREREVALLLALGTSNRDIAKTMTISGKTVEAYIVKLRQKTECATTRRLVVFLAKHPSLLTTTT